MGLIHASILKSDTIIIILPSFFNEIEFLTFAKFPFRGGLGGSIENDDEFPFLRIVELFECSLSAGLSITFRVGGSTHMIAQSEYEHFPFIWPKVAGPQAPSNRTNATAPALIDNSVSG